MNFLENLFNRLLKRGNIATRFISNQNHLNKMNNNPILYHGTHSRHLVYPNHKVGLSGRYWTTHPGEAMDFACTIAWKYKGEMVLIVLPEWDPQHFKDLGEGLAVNRILDPRHWYHSTLLCQEPDSPEQRSVRVYNQSQLEEFVSIYCENKERENLWLQGYLSLLREKI